MLDTCLLRIDNTMLGCISLVQVRRHAGCIVFMEDSYLYTYREEERFVCRGDPCSALTKQ